VVERGVAEHLQLLARGLARLVGQDLGRDGNRRAGEHGEDRERDDELDQGEAAAGG
jgi:hypothetical protein